ncbi:PREDICTED: ribose-phosphate pyrophosphokinase 4-like [Priapulus caudatus]|uniref:Ribose-phosphate pyrophosphokinase 4-like n=1 Tax=Priapulus caudatus TaxID=37621 RepID=A0ABM1FBM4_PRICU|nr:PREDICTED: ribose-phosphate pyrophosphokinase 4-like [Priapulus caudatus]
MSGRPPFVYQNSVDFVIDALKSSKDDVWLLSHSSMEGLAQSIMEHCSAVGFEMKNSTRGVVWKRIVHWEHFQDGFPNIFIDEVKEMAGKDVIFLATFHSPQIIFEQLSVLYAIPRYLARSFHVILPYFATGTMERIDTEGQIATAKTGTFLLLISGYWSRRSDGCANDRLLSAIPLLKQVIDKTGRADVTMAFPDDGAYKRFASSFPNTTMITCNKTRKGDKRVIKLRGGDPMGKDIIIVDDLVQTGGTLIECAKALKQGGAKSISAYVTHAVFPNNSHMKFVDGEVKFENFFITDSLPHAYDIAKLPPFKLLSLAGVIADVLWGYDLMQY